MGLWLSLFPAIVSAPQFDWKPIINHFVFLQENSLIAINYFDYPNVYVLGSLSEPNLSKIYLGYRIVTGYSSSYDECDNTPYITASNQMVHEGIVASNEFPFGTWLEIEDKIYEVQDRMHSRFQNGEIDIWFLTKKEAKEFGKKQIKIYLLK